MYACLKCNDIPFNRECECREMVSKVDLKDKTNTIYVDHLTNIELRSCNFTDPTIIGLKTIIKTLDGDYVY